MPRDNFSDLLAFIAVARARSFTRAAAQLRVSQPALSYTIRQLEEKLGVRLLMRSTRNVSPTEAGQRLLDRLAPEFDEIEAEIQALSELRDNPTGTIRITAIDYAIRSTLWPKLAKFLPKYPDIKVELVSEYESVDIAARGYDAGVRFGEELAQDMISVRIGPDIRNTVVGSKSYFARRTLPKTPHDLTEHACINLRTSTYGGLYEWESSRASARSMHGWTVPLSSTTLTTFSKPQRRASGLPTCRKTWCVPISPRDNSCRFWRTGVRCGLAFTSTIQTAASLRAP